MRTTIAIVEERAVIRKTERRARSEAMRRRAHY